MSRVYWTLAALVLSQLGDVASTLWVLHGGGHELIPLTRWALLHGVPLMVVIKLCALPAIAGATLALAIIAGPRSARVAERALLVVSVVVMLMAAQNVAQVVL